MLFSIGGVSFNSDFYVAHQTSFNENKIVLTIFLSGGIEMTTSTFDHQTLDIFLDKLNTFFDRKSLIMDPYTLKTPPHLLPQQHQPPLQFHHVPRNPNFVFQDNVRNINDQHPNFFPARPPPFQNY